MRISLSAAFLGLLAQGSALKLCYKSAARAFTTKPIKCGSFHIKDSDITYLMGTIHESCDPTKKGGSWIAKANVKSQEGDFHYMKMAVENLWDEKTGIYKVNIPWIISGVSCCASLSFVK